MVMFFLYCAARLDCMLFTPFANACKRLTTNQLLQVYELLSMRHIICVSIAVISSTTNAMHYIVSFVSCVSSAGFDQRTTPHHTTPTTIKAQSGFYIKLPRHFVILFLTLFIIGWLFLTNQSFTQATKVHCENFLFYIFEIVKDRLLFIKNLKHII